ncbi:MAG: acyltransferase family protein, partial [Terriglobales bacterium]
TMNLTASQALLSPLWSLPYELQMYLILPAVFLLTQRRNAGVLLLNTLFAAIAISILLPYVPHTGRLDVVRFVPCTIPGAIAYVIAKGRPSKISFAVWPLVLAAIGTVSTWVPIAHEWWLAWAACLLIGTILPFIAETENQFIRLASHWIAEHSYGIYIAHYFCIWIAFNTNALPGAAQWAIFVTLVILLPAVLYAFLERPMNDYGRRITAARPEIDPAETVIASTAGA